MNTIQNLKTILRLTTSVLVGLSPCLLLGQQALAQPSAESGVSGIEEVVVTARKRAENLQTVPVAVTAISSDELKARKIDTISGLQSTVPGLYIQQSVGDPTSLILTLRGRKQEDSTFAVDSAVGVLVDGFYVPRTSGLAGSMVDIKRVEVLRGPQGTLYGRNTTAGAIGIITKDPTDNFSGSIDLTAGNYGTWDALGILNIPLTDNLDARFVVQNNGHGGYAHNSTGTPLDKQSGEYYRGKLKWTGDNGWEAVLSGHYEYDRSNQPRYFVTALDPANYEGNGLPLGGYLTLEAMGELNISQQQAINLLKSWTASKKGWYLNNNFDQITANLGLPRLPAEVFRRQAMGCRAHRQWRSDRELAIPLADQRSAFAPDAEWRH